MAVATPLTWLLLCLAVQGLGAQESVCEYIKAEYQTSRQVARLEGHINTDMERLTKDVAALADAITRIEHTATELTTRMSAQAEETEKLKAMLGNLKNNTEVEKKVQNATENLASMISNAEARLLATTQNNAALLNASIARVEQTTKDLTTRASFQAEETERQKAMLEDLKKNTEEIGTALKYRGTCQGYYHNGFKTSGVYRLQLPDGQIPMDVYCDMSHEAGYVVFQRRQDGSVNFFRNWTSYEDGFGDLHGEFWLGNRNIHRLTSAGLSQLRVDLQAWNGSTAFALYSHFIVGNASSSYRLSVSGYSGNAGDSMGYDNGEKFSTFDQDHDTYRGVNCAQDWKGAWWYESCTLANLNGEHGSRGSWGHQYVHWYNWLGEQSLQRTELKLK